MLGIILIYWIGKYHYQLAGKYKKNQWGYAILGIVTYYGGIIFSALVFGLVIEILSPGYFEDFNEMLFDVMLIPVGVLSTYMLYKFLEATWRLNKPDPLINSIDVEENSKNII